MTTILSARLEIEKKRHSHDKNKCKKNKKTKKQDINTPRIRHNEKTTLTIPRAYVMLNSVQLYGGSKTKKPYIHNVKNITSTKQTSKKTIQIEKTKQKTNNERQLKQRKIKRWTNNTNQKARERLFMFRHFRVYTCISVINTNITKQKKKIKQKKNKKNPNKQ